jgi:transcription termination factor Rho
VSVLERSELERSPLADLHAIATELGIEGFRRLRRDDLIEEILGHSGGAGAAEAASAEDEDGEQPARRRRGRRGGRGRRRGSGGDEEASADEADKAEPVEGGEVEPEAAEAEIEPPPADAGDGAPEADAEAEPEEPEETRGGTLDILPNGSGFMRSDPFAHNRDDVYVSAAQIRRCELRSGDEIAGPVRGPRRSERHPSLVRVETVNEQPAEPVPERRRFEDLTPVYPTERLPSPEGLEGVPFGKGSRVAVVTPPGVDAAPLLRAVAGTLRDQVELTVVLAGARPEDVTEWRRDGDLPVAGGGFDRSPDEAANAADVALERAKRAVERGADAALVVDSLEGLPPGAARRLFGSARKAEEGGSLTVVAATGTSVEVARAATTRIVLEPATAGGPGAATTVSAASDTTRAELLA